MFNIVVRMRSFRLIFFHLCLLYIAISCSADKKYSCAETVGQSDDVGVDTGTSLVVDTSDTDSFISDPNPLKLLHRYTAADSDLIVIKNGHIVSYFEIGIDHNSETPPAWKHEKESEIELAYPGNDRWGAMWTYATNFHGAPEPTNTNDRYFVDASIYNTLVVEMKGKYGNELVQIGLKDAKDGENAETKVISKALTTTYETHRFDLKLFEGLELNYLYAPFEMVFGELAATVFVKNVWLSEEIIDPENAGPYDLYPEMKKPSDTEFPVDTSIEEIDTGEDYSSPYLRLLSSCTAADGILKVIDNGRKASCFDVGIDHSSEGLPEWMQEKDSEIELLYPGNERWGAMWAFVTNFHETPEPENIHERYYVDASKYNTLEVQMKGKYGGELVQIGLKDAEDGENEETKILSKALTTTYENHRFDLRLFEGLDLTQLYAPFEIVFGELAATISVANVALSEEIVDRENAGTFDYPYPSREPDTEVPVDTSIEEIDTGEDYSSPCPRLLYSCTSTDSDLVIIENGKSASCFDIGIDHSNEEPPEWKYETESEIELVYPGNQDWGAMWTYATNFHDIPEPTVILERYYVDASMYETLDVEMRGQYGGELVQIGLKDATDGENEETKVLSKTLTTTYETHRFDLDLFEGLDLTQLYAPFEIVFGAQPVTVSIRNVRLSKAAIDPTAAGPFDYYPQPPDPKLIYTYSDFNGDLPILKNGDPAQFFDIGVDSGDDNFSWCEKENDAQKLVYDGDEGGWAAMWVNVLPDEETPEDETERHYVDCTVYSTVVMEIKGEEGGEAFAIGMKDFNAPNNASEHREWFGPSPSAENIITTEYQEYTFELSQFITEDFSKLFMPIEFVFTSDTPPGTIYVKNVTFKL